MPSLYQEHCEKWKGLTSTGCGSGLCEKARNICLARGSIPCDVLFIGEAPGHSEDVIGQPFVGPAGRLLDQIISRAIPKWSLRLSFTNLVGCLPQEDDGSKSGEPTDEEIRACAPRLREFIEIARPRLIVCVGSLASDWVPRVLKGEEKGKANKQISVNLLRELSQIEHIIHPAAILRANIAQQGFMKRKAILTLQQAVKDL